jgi:hypothetical protein
MDGGFAVAQQASEKFYAVLTALSGTINTLSVSTTTS